MKFKNSELRCNYQLKTFHSFPSIPTKAQESFPIDIDLHHFRNHRLHCAIPKIPSIGWEEASMVIFRSLL